MQLSQLILSIQPIAVVGNLDKEITNLQFDSRKVEQGSLFFAVPGTAMDGHDFIPKAIEQGAVAIIGEKPLELLDFGTLELLKSVTYIQVSSTNKAIAAMANMWYDYPSRKLKLIGVTGTNGKTTIATLLFRLCRTIGHRAGLLSTVCNFVENRAISATHTTPDALALNSLLAEMVNEGCEYAFMEVSSHSIAQDRIYGLDFDGAVFTNLTRDHIDFHKTFDNYRDTKKQLFDNLKDTAFAVTNADDKNGLIMTQNCKAQVFTYSTCRMADYQAKIMEESFEGMLLQINRQEVFVPLVGRFNTSNILAIYAAAMGLGFDSQQVLQILSVLRPVNGRFETIHSPKGWTAIVDYAHTPDAVENVIRTINEIRKKDSRLITVVGCGGNRDKGKRPMMARIAAEGSTDLILTSDNPRLEDPQDILNDMIAGLQPVQLIDTKVIIDRHEAIQTACQMAEKDDVILIAGKGHEDYQIIGTTKHHFDDHEEVKKYC